MRWKVALGVELESRPFARSTLQLFRAQLILPARPGNDKPREIFLTSLEEAKRGAEASLVSSMGRMAAHTGQVITWDNILNCEHEFAPGVDKLTMDSPAPLLADADGKYPVPRPGIVKNREY